MKKHGCPLKCDRFYDVYHCGTSGGQLFLPQFKSGKTWNY